MTRVLVFGGGGQVGRELLSARLSSGWTIAGRNHQSADITDRAAVDRAVAEARPDIVINAAAYTAVDRAESERDAAYAVNETGASHVAAASAGAGVPLIHLSTDYVFDGTKTDAYVEEDATNPLSVYGSSKEAGERAVRAVQPRHVILRTSWVFAAHGANFVRTMLRLGVERPELRTVADQRGGPTAAPDIAATCIRVAEALVAGRAECGTYHYAGAPVTTWHGFASAIFAAAAAHGRPAPKLAQIATAEYKTAARRPANSELDCAKIERVFGIARPDWRPALTAVVAELMREGDKA
jgi:dTDP-4-dehydrorhamnose reductase